MEEVMAPLDVDTYSNKFLARIDWNANDKNKFTLRYSLLDARSMNFSNKQAAARLNDNGYYMKNSTHSIVAELNTQISSLLANELRVGWTRVRDNRDPLGQAMPYVKIEQLSENTSLEFGTERFSMANSLNQDIFTLTDNLTRMVGKPLYHSGNL